MSLAAGHLDRLRILYELYVEGGVTIDTPLPGGAGELGYRTVILPDGDVIVRVSSKLVGADDWQALWARHQAEIGRRVALLVGIGPWSERVVVWARRARGGAATVLALLFAAGIGEALAAFQAGLLEDAISWMLPSVACGVVLPMWRAIVRASLAGLLRGWRRVARR